MALTRDKAKIKDNIYTLTVDGQPFPHYLSMRMNLGYREKEQVSGAVGTTPLGDLILGYAGEITIDVTQVREEIEEFLDLTSGEPIAVGSFRPDRAVVIHPVSAGADDSHDIFIPVATFGPTVDTTKDGTREDTATIMIRCRHNPSGPAWHRGPLPV